MHSKPLLLFLLLLLAFSPATAMVIDKIAAIVNNDVITDSEVYAMGKLGLQLSGLPEKENILQKRIDHHLVFQQLINQPPISLPEEDVQDAISSYAENYGGIEELTNFLTTIGMNYADFEAEVRQEMSIRKFIRDRFRPFLNITIEEVEKYYETVYKPALEFTGKEAPPFAESFNEVQTQMIESMMQDRITAWLEQIRREATINIKD